MTQAIQAAEEMKTLNTNVAKASFASIAGFFPQPAPVYDDTEINKDIDEVIRNINDVKTRVGPACGAI